MWKIYKEVVIFEFTLLPKNFRGITDEDHATCDHIAYMGNDMKSEPSRYKLEEPYMCPKFSVIG